MKHGPQHQILMHAFEQISRRLDDLEKEYATATPIEVLMGSALFVELTLAAPGIIPFYRSTKPGDLPSMGEKGMWVMFLSHQVSVIPNWRSDFCLTVRNRSRTQLARLIIECDGHDFHERTKEQAKKDRSRDREVQDMGHSIHRYTGAEIWADPVSCARTAMNWAYKMILALGD